MDRTGQLTVTEEQRAVSCRTSAAAIISQFTDRRVSYDPADERRGGNNERRRGSLGPGRGELTGARDVTLSQSVILDINKPDWRQLIPSVVRESRFPAATEHVGSFQSQFAFRENSYDAVTWNGRN